MVVVVRMSSDDGSGGSGGDCGVEGGMDLGRPAPPPPQHTPTKTGIISSISLAYNGAPLSLPSCLCGNLALPLVSLSPLRPLLLLQASPPLLSSTVSCATIILESPLKFPHLVPPVRVPTYYQHVFQYPFYAVSAPQLYITEKSVSY